MLTFTLKRFDLFPFFFLCFLSLLRLWRSLLFSVFIPRSLAQPIHKRARLSELLVVEAELPTKTSL